MSDNQQSYYVRSGLFSFFEKGSMFVFGAFGFMVLARLISPSEMGVWVTFLSLVTIVEMAITGLIQNGLIRYLTNAKEEEYGDVLSAGLVLHISFSILAVVLLFIGSSFLAQYFNQAALSQLFRWYCLSLLLLVPLNFFNFLQQANFNFQGIFWSNFSRKGIFFFLLLVYFILDMELNLLEILFFQMAGIAIAALVAIGFGKKYFTIVHYRLEKKWISDLLHYGKYVFGTNLSTMLYKTIDKFMLAKFLNPIAVGLYEAAIKVTNMVDVPSTTVAAVVFPQSAVAKGGNQKQQTKVLYERSVGAILAIILPFIALVFLFDELILLVLAGAEYVDAVPVLRLTALYGLFLPFAVQFGTILDSTGRPKVNFYFNLGGVILNIIFNYLFIVSFGYGLMGAAYGTLLTYGITFVIYQVVLNRLFGVNTLAVFGYIPDFYKQAWQIGSTYISKISKT